MRRFTALVLAVLILAIGAPAAEAALLKAGNFACVAAAAPPEPASPRLIFAGFWGDGTQPAGVLRSVDGGLTWTNVLALRAAALAADPLTPGVVYAATESGLHKSADYGVSWSLIDPRIKTWVVVNTGNPAIIYGDNLRSIDGGGTWTAMSGLPAVFVPPYTGSFDRTANIKVTAATPNFLLALAGGVYRSVDGGATWTALTGTYRSDFYSVEIDPRDPRYFYVGYCQYLQRWYPGGSELVTTSGGDEYAIVVDGAAHSRIFMSGQSYSQKSLNFGDTWTISSEIPLNSRPGRMIHDKVLGALFVPTLTGLHQVVPPSCIDADGDGAAVGLPANCGVIDCNDANPAIFPGAPEVCTDGADNNCNGLVDCADAACPGTATCPCIDADLDTFSPAGALCGLSDCNDANAAINPGVSETCNNYVDDNCNGKTDCDEAACYGTATCPCTDMDGDGYSTDGGNCGPLDCEDWDASFHPGAPEVIFDGWDQDCNGYDLTIRITKATWSRTTGLLTVTATSGYAEVAGLTIVTSASTAPMTWVPPAKRSAGYWAGTKIDPANPGTVTVTGFEGSVTGPVKAVR